MATKKAAPRTKTPGRTRTAAGASAPGARHPGIDAYIAKSRDFARPILAHLRAVVHEACPEVEESLKWSAPNFGYKGMLCGMAAFKEHCAFGFWKGALVTGDAAKSKDAMWSFGRITSLKDLPSDATLKQLIRKAMALNASGTKVVRPVKDPARRRHLDIVPDDLARAFRRNAAARKAFEGFSPSQRREYVEWLVDAKRPETREKRLLTAIEWMAEGKTRNWQYQ